MSKRRSKGDGGLHWDDKRQRWIATAALGYHARGKRIVKRASGKTKTEAKNKLRDIKRDHEEGLPSTPDSYTVADAVSSWLTYGLNGRSTNTIANYRYQVDGHIIPYLGRRKLRDLSAEDVDKWLAERSAHLSTRTLRLLHSILNRAINHAQARGKARRNVVALCEIPTGLKGRASKALTLDQAEAVLSASEHSPLHAYIVLSLLVGARTEELREITWQFVDLDGDPSATPPIPPSIAVWHSVREGGDTKTKKSRRTLALPTRCVTALRAHRLRQEAAKRASGTHRQEIDLVFPSAAGTPLDSHNVRRGFRKVIKAAGLNEQEWTPREMRHSFVSLLSALGTPLEDIARLVGHSGTAVTETVYRKQIRPIMVEGAIAMDHIFPTTQSRS